MMEKRSVRKMAFFALFAVFASITVAGAFTAMAAVNYFQED